MQTFVIVMLILLAVGVGGNVYSCHQLLQGEQLEQRPATHFVVALIDLGLLIWGLTLLS